MTWSGSDEGRRDAELVREGVLTEREAARLPQWAKRKIVRLMRERAKSREMTIVVLEGDVLEQLVASIMFDPASVRRLRVARDGDDVKVKFNESTWSPPYPHVEFGRPVTEPVDEPEPPSRQPAGQSHPALITDEQVELLAAALRLEDPFCRDEIDQATYDAAQRAAVDAGLGDALERLAEYFTSHHFSASEISACASEAREILTVTYARR